MAGERQADVTIVSHHSSVHLEAQHVIIHLVLMVPSLCVYMYIRTHVHTYLHSLEQLFIHAREYNSARYARVGGFLYRTFVVRAYVRMCVCLWHLICAFHLMTGACRLPDYLGGQEEEERNDGTAFGAEWGEVSRLG